MEFLSKSGLSFFKSLLDLYFATKSYVNKAISTNTGKFWGTFNDLADLQEITGSNGDYAYVIVPDDYSTSYDRYKWQDNQWVYEYTVGGESFDDDQWAAINSGITASDKQRLTEISNNIGNNSISEMRSDIDANASEIEEINEELSDIDAALATKANVDGYYESMAVGQADNLKGQVLIPNDAAFRTSGGSEDVDTGLAHLQNVKGNTVSWNQIVGWGVNDYETGTYENGDFTVEIEDNAVKVICNVTGYESTAFACAPTHTGRARYIQGHKYLFRCIYKTSDAKIRISVGTNTYEPTKSSPTWDEYVLIGTWTSTSGLTIMPTFYIGGCQENGVIWFKDIVAFDLTLIYGAGNEPTTTEQFEADYEKWFGKPLTYESYNAGELIPAKTTALKTTGFNQLNNGSAKVIGGNAYQITGTYTSMTLDGETVTPDSSGIFTPDHTGELTVAGYSNDTCVHLVWSGTRNGEYDPYESHTLQLPLTTLTGKLNGTGESVVVFPNGMHKFDRIYTSCGKTYGEVGGETRAYQSGDATNDTMITDGHAYTYVQSATPQVYELDNFTLPATFRVNDWGTEEQIHADDVASVPAILNSLYAVNAVDTIRRLPQNYISQESMDNFLAQLGAAMGGTWTKTFNTTTNEFEFSFTQSASLMSVSNNEETNNEEES